MKESHIKIGDVLVVALPGSIPSGHEQTGLRPTIVVGLPHKIGIPRYPMLLVAPLTTQSNGSSWAKESPFLYPVIQSKTSGLVTTSVVLLDQLRAIDVQCRQRLIQNPDAAKVV